MAAVNPSTSSGVPQTTVGNVLLVEDHDSTREALYRLLKRRGFVVLGAGSLAEAERLAAENTFDCMVCDLDLPDGSGHSLMQRFAEKYRLPGIAMSGHGLDEDVAMSRQAGFCKHLTKPVDIAKLTEALTEFIRGSQE